MLASIRSVNQVIRIRPQWLKFGCVRAGLKRVFVEPFPTMKAQMDFLWRMAPVSVAVVLLTLAHAQTELVFHDNFNASPSNDINSNLAARQSGTAGVVRYLESAATGDDGGIPYYTEIYDDRLYLWASQGVSPENTWTWVSPDRNFTDGPTFTVEFDLDPSVLDPGRTSADWAAIVFGATAPGQFVNASDGMGILFRSNGQIQVFNGTAAIYGSENNPLPAGQIRVRIEVTGQGFSGTAPATVALFVNNTPVALTESELTFTRAAGFQGNYLTLQGYAGSGTEWQYTFDHLTLRANTCVRLDPQEIILEGVAPGTVAISLKVPSTFNGGQGGTVVLRSSNPGVISIVGAQNNELTVPFNAGGPTSQSVTLGILGSGRARILMETTAPDCLGEPAMILTPLDVHLRNPSFESNYDPAWPHYSAIDEWIGGSGVNRAAGPFHDNGVIPDGAQIAFLQGASTLSQLITGLEPGRRYWLQVRYNARGCCGGETPDMTLAIDGVVLGTESAIQPSGSTYYFRNWEFVPTANEALLEISSRPHAGGDATLLVDAVSVIQRDAGNVVLQNPSFEASGLVALPGIFTEQRIAGWQGEGTFGLNLAGDPFADNGITPHQNFVAFVQGMGSLSQNLTGLIPGETYQVRFAYNARSGNQPRLRVTAGTLELLDTVVDSVGNAPYHQASLEFLASSPSAMLQFAQVADGDQTVLIDDVRVTGQAINLPCIQLSPENAQLSVGQTSSEFSVKLLEDVVATGPAIVTVTSSDPAVVSLPGAVNGTLTLTFQPGGNLVQNVQVTAVSRGAATLLFSESRGVCFDRPGIPVLVLSGYVRNPSFEANAHPSFPGYGPISAWASEGGGNTGINNASGPFHDNGVIPDGAQVALMQNSKIIRQEVVNLTPGQGYWLQFSYNVRSSTAANSLDLVVRFAGTVLTTISGIQPVLETNPYHFAHLEFTPNASSGLLEFEAVEAPGLDATVLLDAVTIVRRNAGGIVIRNPSFEASGLVASPGYIDNSIAGWSAGGGGRGVNVSGIGPFADNGTNPDQDNVLFLQGGGTFVSQTLSGLTAGQNYTVRFGANARTGNQPVLKVMLGDSVASLLAIPAVGNGNSYRTLEVVLPATASEADLRFEQTAEGDHTVLLDNVLVVPGGTLPEPRPHLSVTRDLSGNIRLSWPANVEGFLLQSANAVHGIWQNAPEPVVLEGDRRITTVEPTADARYFRLTR
jgi:hypothetical protein